jgi:hypothetical protein
METVAASAAPRRHQRLRHVILVLGVLTVAVGLAVGMLASEFVWSGSACLAAFTAYFVLYLLYPVFGGRMIIFHNITGAALFVCFAVGIWVLSSRPGE